MMMKAEIASEMIRSRSQTPKPVRARTGFAGANSAFTGAEGVSVTIPGVLSELGDGMWFYCIQVHCCGTYIYLPVSGTSLVEPASSLFSGRLQYWHPRGIHDASPLSEKDRLSQPNPGLPVHRNAERVGPVGGAAGRRRRAGLYRGASTQRDEAAAHPHQG